VEFIDNGDGTFTLYIVKDYRGYPNFRCRILPVHTDHLWLDEKYGRVHCPGHH